MSAGLILGATRGTRAYSVDTAYQANGRQYNRHASQYSSIPEVAEPTHKPQRYHTSNIEDDDTQQLRLIQRYGYTKEDLDSFDSEAKPGTSDEAKCQVLIKRTRRTSLQATRDVEREIEVLAAVQDPSVFRLIESFELKDVIWTVIEHRPLRTVGELVKVNGPISEEVLRVALNQLFSGIASIFMAGFAHLRICDQTVCFDSDLRLVITDFKYCCVYGTEETDDNYAMTQEKYGDDIYTAPEVFSSINYNARKAVIWSLGVLLYFMVTAQTDKLSNLDHPSFEHLRKQQSAPPPTEESFETPSSSSRRRKSSASVSSSSRLPMQIIHYPTNRFNIPNYARWILPKMLLVNPRRRPELIEICPRVPKDFASKVTRPLMEVAWLDYKTHVRQLSGAFDEPEFSDSGSRMGSIFEGLESGASSIYSMASALSNPFKSLLGRDNTVRPVGRARRVSAPVKSGGWAAESSTRWG